MPSFVNVPDLLVSLSWRVVPRILGAMIAAATATAIAVLASGGSALAAAGSAAFAALAAALALSSVVGAYYLQVVTGLVFWACVRMYRDDKAEAVREGEELVGETASPALPPPPPPPTESST